MWNLLEWIYPLMSDADCVLREEGNGAFIYYWNTQKLGPQPTEEYLNEQLPEFEFESLRTQRIHEVNTHVDSLIETAGGNLDSKDKSKKLSRNIKILNKKIDRRASVKELEELEEAEVLDDYVDNVDSCKDEAEQYLENLERTFQELQNYNANIDPQWPVFE